MAQDRKRNIQLESEAEAHRAEMAELQAQPSSVPLQGGSPLSLLQQAFDGVKKIGAASAAALEESKEKAAAERRQQPRKPKGNLKALYRDLDRAIDRDDFESAAQIKRRIDELK